MNLGILVPVWRDYQWIAPILHETLDRWWPSHPGMWFCGLSDPLGLPAFPLEPGTDRSNWTQVLLGGVRNMRALGIEKAYLILEEHIPLGPCHEEHLNRTLPALMDELSASYLSLMGWDNRRYSSRSPVLDPARYQLKHLTGEIDSRFHLHPALWDLEVLETCCRLALRDSAANGSAWHFEKACSRSEAALSVAAKSGCYQIRASRLAWQRPSRTAEILAPVERFVFHKLMALYPWIKNPRAARAFLRCVPFDDVFCNGPYPMFYSGIMAKGGMNRFFVRHLRRNHPDLLDRILAARPTQ